jgi:hypothetical protein
VRMPCLITETLLSKRERGFAFFEFPILKRTELGSN